MVRYKMFRLSDALCLSLLTSCLVSALKTTSFEDVLLLNTGTFPSHVQSQTTFVMFYAPWCGHCKKLMPTWAELAQKYTADTLNVAKVDCTMDTKLCSDERVRGYPTLLLYNPYGGQEQQNGVRFSGARTISALTEFIKQNSNVDTASVQFDLEGSVYVMTKDNYVEIFKQPAAFVMFYAPWCKHCKALQPVWEELAAEYNTFEHKTPTAIAKIDCTKHDKVCAEMEISAYPTLLYLKKGKLVTKYDGPRELDDLQAFVNHQYNLHSEGDGDETSGQVPVADELDSDPVLGVTGATFQETIASANTLIFMKFYTPWCGHCKKLAPVWNLLAQHYTTDSSIAVAKIDCTEHAHICQAQQINGFPTLKLYKNSKVVAEYAGDRSFPDLIQFVSRHHTKDEL